MKTVRVGQMPGQINEFAVEVGTSIRSLLETAGLNPTGFSVKVDGNEATNLDSAVVTSSTNLVILAKQVKGNGYREVRIGQMPGQINTYGVEVGSTVAQAIEIAGLNPSGFSIKVDGVEVTDLHTSYVRDNTSLILLAKQVKGNK
jgi:sulfur carrier protein ThiS